MPQDLVDRLKQIQSEVARNSQQIPKLTQLAAEAKQAFNDKIEQLVSQYQLTRKIQVPKFNIRLWKRGDRQIQFAVNIRYLLSAPFIYGMVLPALLWHVCIEIYHQVCFRLYGIPRVSHRDYFVYDRQLLAWLNFWEKVNCIYCSYVNNLIRYSTEIGGRTERYWCPIKYFRKIENSHSQYPKFVEGKDPRKMRQEWEELRDFSDLK